MKLTFLGTRGEIDLRTDRRRMHTSLMIAAARSRVMIDCGLDWLEAVWTLRPKPHAIVLTHAHPDHAWGLQRGAPCPVHATAETWKLIRNYPIEERHTIEPRKPTTIRGISFEAFPVEHSTRAPAVGFRIVAGGSTIFYVPDVVYIVERTSALAGVSLYIGDGATVQQSFVRKRGDHLIGHAPISTQLTWCQKESIPRAMITHCGSQIVSNEEKAAAAVRTLAEKRGIETQIAYDGLEIRV